MTPIIQRHPYMKITMLTYWCLKTRNYTHVPGYIQKVLHLSCYNNNEELTNLYMNYLQAQIDRNVFTKEQIREWINLQNDEGFTALHLAAYRGSLKSVELLESYGADNKIRNYNELTVLHTAAQGDSPVTCYYYIKKGFDINAMDNKGSTPLHWAAYSGAFNSVNFLLTWGSNINQQDLDTGVTALHLAVMQGNTRIVRKLLMKGIDRNIRESSGKSAQDLATEQDFNTIAIMIRDKIGILEYCNVRQPFRPVVKRSRSLFAFMSMYLTCFVLTIVFTFPYVVNTAWLIAFFVLTIQTVVYFLISWLMDPGIVQPDKHVDMLQMLSKYDCSTICAECQLVRPKRSKHCDVCQKCVMVYDHHCPWINNCVGARNLFVFYLFVLSLFLELMLQILMQAQHVTQQDTIRFFESNNWLITGKYVTFGYVLLYCISFSIPIGILLYFQTVNIFVGQTTFERHSMGAQQTTTQTLNDEESSIESLQPKKPQAASASLSNCFEMCFQNRGNSEYTRDMSANMIEL